MKKVISFFLIQLFCFTAGFAQSPPWKANGETISPRPDLDVRWEDSKKFPSKVWTYQLLPNRYSDKIISNVLTLCSLTEKDLKEYRLNGMNFQSADGSRKLSISFPSGDIHFETPEPDWGTNLAVGVPKESELPKLTKNVLRELGISFSEITGWIGDHKMDFVEGGGVGTIGDITITNITYQRVYFRRTVDGMPIAGAFYGFNFGEHGKISKISITWPKLECLKSYLTVSQKDVINSLRRGNAIRGPVSQNVGDIDWSTIKSVTITKAVPSYLVDGSRLYPFLRMDANVDTGHENVTVAIDCPIFDETK
jgi:hypothetical protein